MTISRTSLIAAGLAFALSATPFVVSSQGKGGGKGHGAGGEKQPHGQGQAKAENHGQEKAKGPSHDNSPKHTPEARGNSSAAKASHAAAKETGYGNPSSVKSNGKAHGNFARAASISSMPAAIRRYAATGRPQDVIMAAAVSHAIARGHDNDFRIDQVGNRMRLSNRNGEPLLYLDDESARNLGRWRVGVLNDEVRDGAPSFCRSGAGHPVWGREWCIDKGFGLGDYNDYRWGRADNIGNIVFPNNGISSVITSSVLANLLGNTTFNRLALHAVTLGLLEPLTGRWVSQPTGPQMLMVNSGNMPVAELADSNRDYRIDDLLVALLPWM